MSILGGVDCVSHGRASALAASLLNQRLHNSTMLSDHAFITNMQRYPLGNGCCSCFVGQENNP